MVISCQGNVWVDTVEVHNYCVSSYDNVNVPTLGTYVGIQVYKETDLVPRQA